MYQCPLTGFLHFYRSIKFYRKTINVSMPFNGLSSFLRYNTYQSRQKRHMYQCPLTGFLYFYKTNFFSENDDALVYQCPLTGFLYFYTFRDLNTIMNQHCINALSRAFFISTSLQRTACKNERVYQCPLTGFLYFYDQLRKRTIHLWLYQCPLTGFLYFYTAWTVSVDENIKGINAL